MSQNYFDTSAVKENADHSNEAALFRNSELSLSQEVLSPTVKKVISIELTANELLNPSWEYAHVPQMPELGLDPITQQKALTSLTEVVQIIMGEHKYVSFDLNDKGRAVHLTNDPFDGILIHVVSPGTLPSGTRYTDIEKRIFLPSNVSFGTVHELITDANKVIKEASQIVNELRQFIEDRASKPLVVQVSTQGYHENHPGKLKLGIVDTGGQDKYINDSGITMTRLGFNVLNVNRAGPNHCENGDVRRGMHYSHTGMDLLFIEDSKVSQFVPKESMYPEEKWTTSPPKDIHFYDMAKDLVRSLLREPQGKQFLMIGHYADGGMVALHARDIIADMIRNDELGLGSKGFKVPLVASNPHSLGPLKERGLIDGGEKVPASLRLDVRKQFEQYVADNVDIKLTTSSLMTDSMKSDFGYSPDYLMTPGIDVHQFSPRPTHLSRNDKQKYGHIWDMFSKLNGQPVNVLQNATIVMEASRSARTKGKDIVIQAFARSLSEEDMLNNKKFLAINIADPKRDNIAPEEKALGEELHKLVDELGIRPWLITKNDFLPTEVALMHQVADIFITGSSSEPWGMSAQQAAASCQPIVSTTNVPSVTEVLIQDINNQNPHLDGALCFEPGDVNGAAAALKTLYENKELGIELAQRAFERTIPDYSWEGIVKRFFESHIHAKGSSEQVKQYEFTPTGKIKAQNFETNYEVIPRPDLRPNLLN